MATKAQGLPINLIILAIVAALVLVIVVAFTVGGTSNVFGKISKSSAVVGGDFEAVRATCKSFCDRAQSLSSTDDWVKSQYCARTFSVDLDRDGKTGTFDQNGVTAAGGKYNAAKQLEIGLNCWDPAISVNCQSEIVYPDGTTKTCIPVAGQACGVPQCA